MSQQTIHTKDAGVELSKLIDENPDRRVLIVTGKHCPLELPSIVMGRDAQVQVIALQAGIPEIDLLAQELRSINTRPDLLIAIGGGRVIDAAKYFLDQWLRDPAGNDPAIEFVAIPTTAGSGSEATPFAVVYDEGVKQSLEHPSFLPGIVILDARLCTAAPTHQRAISAADALTQAIESMWNVHATEVSLRFAGEAIHLLSKNFLFFIESPEAVAHEMLYAAHLAGKAIAITRTTGCHALSYYLTAHHGVPHGQAVALFLPVFFNYNEEAGLEAIYALLEVDNANEAAVKIKKLMHAAGLSTDFSQLGISVDINKLLASVNAQRFANNPVPFDASKLTSLINLHLL